jgi:hypothetical protein
MSLDWRAYALGSAFFAALTAPVVFDFVRRSHRPFLALLLSCVANGSRFPRRADRQIERHFRRTIRRLVPGRAPYLEGGAGRHSGHPRSSVDGHLSRRAFYPTVRGVAARSDRNFSMPEIAPMQA